MFVIGLWLISIVVAIITGIFAYVRWHYGELENTKGLKSVVKPYFIGGSDPFFYKTICHEDDMKRAKKYGKVFGFYEGREPHIYITDVKLIKQILIKKFDHFHSKRKMDFGHDLINEHIDLLPYDTWKVVRGKISPQLTGRKIRSMNLKMQDAINDWMIKLNTKVSLAPSRAMNPRDLYEPLTIDIIGRCGLGTRIDAPMDSNNDFIQKLRKYAFDVDSTFLSNLPQMFPFLSKMQPMVPHEIMDYFGDLVRRFIKEGKYDLTDGVNDFLGLMNHMMDELNTPEYSKLNISETTVICQAMIFLLAGFETLAATLTMISFRLAKDASVQEKVIKEIDEYLERHEGKIQHETMGELVYLHAVLCETLRMHPTLIRIERACQKNWKDEESGLEIKKGTIIQIPVYAVHYDEENFPNPMDFQPERFMPENKEAQNPYAFLAFGHGPHNCIGMRLAKEEIKMTLATLLKDFEFKDTETVELKCKPGRTFFSSYEPFKISLVRRTRANVP